MERNINYLGVTGVLSLCLRTKGSHVRIMPGAPNPLSFSSLRSPKNCFTKYPIKTPSISDSLQELTTTSTGANAHAPNRKKSHYQLATSSSLLATGSVSLAAGFFGTSSLYQLFTPPTKLFSISFW
jgi:hypothetical protein